MFYVESLENTVYSLESKRELKVCLEREAESMKGDQMIYNLTEWLREHLVTYVDLSKQQTRQATTLDQSSSQLLPLVR